MSGGVKCGVDADSVPVGSLPAGSPRSCGVPVCTTRTVEFDHQPQLILDFAQKDVEYKTNEVSEKSPDCMGMEQRKRKQAAAAQL